MNIYPIQRIDFRVAFDIDVSEKVTIGRVCESVHLDRTQLGLFAVHPNMWWLPSPSQLLCCVANESDPTLIWLPTRWFTCYRDSGLSDFLWPRGRISCRFFEAMSSIAATIRLFSGRYDSTLLSVRDVDCSFLHIAMRHRYKALTSSAMSVHTFETMLHFKCVTCYLMLRSFSRLIDYREPHVLSVFWLLCVDS